MSRFKLSAVVITTVFVFVALMSMQLSAASSVEAAAHTNENHRKLTKSRFLVSDSMH
jgi:Flp pilus assembly protein CpaB